MTIRTCRVGVHGRNNEVFERLKKDNPNIDIITRLHDDRIHHGHP